MLNIPQTEDRLENVTSYSASLNDYVTYMAWRCDVTIFFYGIVSDLVYGVGVLLKRNFPYTCEHLCIGGEYSDYTNPFQTSLCLGAWYRCFHGHRACNCLTAFVTLLDAFAVLLKETVSFVISACPTFRLSFSMEQLGSHWTDFHEIWYLSIFRKSVQKNRSFYWNPPRKTGTWHENQQTAQHDWSYFAHFFLEMRNVSDKVVEKIKTHILC